MNCKEDCCLLLNVQAVEFNFCENIVLTVGRILSVEILECQSKQLLLAELSVSALNTNLLCPDCPVAWHTWNTSSLRTYTSWNENSRPFIKQSLTTLGHHFIGFRFGCKGVFQLESFYKCLLSQKKQKWNGWNNSVNIIICWFIRVNVQFLFVWD